MRGPVNLVYSINSYYGHVTVKPSTGKNFILHAPKSMDFFKFRTHRKVRNRGVLKEERTNHYLLRINLNPYPITPEQS